ncbi:hypothetical protein BASA61_007434 [Batrachochytrium salamandrivorans]|nr:hypothetical protein BASA61_007434 [Batrachochytrium salamandrivorans]
MASHTHSGIGWWSANKSVSQLPQGDPGGISTMWIDTVRYAICRKSADLLYQYPIIMPRPHGFMLYSPHPTNKPGQICFAHLRLHRRAKYMHSPHPDRVLRPSSLSRDF